jgi:hypothetical protein
MGPRLKRGYEVYLWGRIAFMHSGPTDRDSSGRQDGLRRPYYQAEFVDKAIPFQLERWSGKSSSCKCTVRESLAPNAEWRA